VFGTIAVIDLRLLGRASAERPFQRVTADILKWTWAGFLLAAVTGLLMFTTNATVYYHNLFFRLKMLLLLLAAVNMGAFELSAGRRVEEWGKNRSAPPVGRVVAVLSLVIWVGVIFAGRAIGFTTSRAKEAAPAVDVNFDDLFQGPPAKK